MTGFMNVKILGVGESAATLQFSIQESDMAVENNGAATAKVDGHNAIFTVLRQLLKPYESALAIRTDKPGNCYLETRSPA